MEMEFEELTVEELLNRITNDDSLRQAFISRLSRVTGSNDDSPAVHVSTSANSLQATGSYQSGIYTSSPLDSSSQLRWLPVRTSWKIQMTHWLPGRTSWEMQMIRWLPGRTSREVQVTHWLLGRTRWEVQVIHWLPGCTSW